MRFRPKVIQSLLYIIYNSVFVQPQSPPPESQFLETALPGLTTVSTLLVPMIPSPDKTYAVEDKPSILHTERSQSGWLDLHLLFSYSMIIDKSS